MQISTKGRYGLRLLVDLAHHQGEGSVSLRDISARQEISIKYLWQVINVLKGAGFVAVTRGAHGGFRLVRPPSKITLLDIVSTLEGPIALVPCLSEGEVCRRAGDCAARPVWNQVEQALSETLRSVTLADIARADAASGDYAI